MLKTALALSIAAGAFAILTSASASAAPFSPPLNLACEAAPIFSNIPTLSIAPALTNPALNPCATAGQSAHNYSALGLSAAILIGQTKLQSNNLIGASAHGRVESLSLNLNTVLGISPATLPLLTATVAESTTNTVCENNSRVITSQPSVTGFTFGAINFTGTTPQTYNVATGLVIHLNAAIPVAGALFTIPIWIEAPTGDAFFGLSAAGNADNHC